MATLRSQAFSYVNSRGVSLDNVAWTSGFAFEDTRVAYLKQSFNGIPVSNAVANIVFDGTDSVYAYSSSFVNATSIADPNPTFSWRSVLPDLERKLDSPLLDNNATLEYVVKDDGSVALANVIQLRNETLGSWYEVFIDGHTGDILSINDFVADASYTVVPITKISFDDGVETLQDPADLQASPFGWHSTGFGDSTVGSGNNALVFLDGAQGQGRFVNQTSDGLNFDYTYDDNNDPRTEENQNAARVNAFYVANTVHDVAYRYGFTEINFNFQMDNFDKGGKEDDRVIISVHDQSGVNNANFATPPDGRSGVCRMFIWDLSNPNRDGSMQNDIIIHEYTHGITNRLTGGGTARCLQTPIAGGLGEGWGDALANWFQQKSATVTDFVMAAYVANRAKGIRTFPYSTNQGTNPLTYADLQERSEVHEIGEVWATILHDVYAALVGERGFSDQKFTNPDGPEGNIVFMRLFMDSLSMQPCNPTFVQTRAAWFTADQRRYNGANRCILARAFAGRGLGEGADNTFKNDRTVPAGC
ncbi:Fungalysin metallopeptidase-domain-containing protein [Panaeolus papilionaceus]|nr:Fungalysin metallopeptidase-domain-containing protein [Panaeolus papilionaceus]